jgi:hypothetical protein
MPTISNTGIVVKRKDTEEMARETMDANEKRLARTVLHDHEIFVNQQQRSSE